METVQQNGRFTLLGSARIKSAHRTLMKLTPGLGIQVISVIKNIIVYFGFFDRVSWQKDQKQKCATTCL